jgi:C4-type Zn-finger protein
MKPGEFTPEAALLWSSIAPKDRELILKNVYCPGCSDSAEMVRFSGEVKAGDVILTGSCAKCGHKVLRVLETSERNPARN